MKKTTAETLVDNLKHLMRLYNYDAKKVSRLSGLSPRAVAYYVSGERVPNIDRADELAKVFGLEGWHLIMPNLPKDIENSKKLSSLIRNYLSSNDEGKDIIGKIAEREAVYKEK